MHASVQVHANVLMPGLAFHLALGLAYHAIECSLDVPVRHIVAFYLAAHYSVSLVSVSVLELKAISC
jgi:hypothetical protein